jgi:protein-S-isoprenylcysteine O-methyltransferase Ste14
MEFDKSLQIVFLIGLAVAEGIRAPHRWRNRRNRKQNQIQQQRVTGREWVLMIWALIGMWLMPPFYVLTPWLDFADYRLPQWAGIIGLVVYAVAFCLLWRSLKDLGRNWSPTLEIWEGHWLVTCGVYRYIRHPMYASLLLWGIAQALLLQNFIAGVGGGSSFLPLYLLRVEREEQMMSSHFGEDYRRYMTKTGRIMPRFGDKLGDKGD